MPICFSISLYIGVSVADTGDGSWPMMQSTSMPYGAARFSNAFCTEAMVSSSPIRTLAVICAFSGSTLGLSDALIIVKAQVVVTSARASPPIPVRTRFRRGEKNPACENTILSGPFISGPTFVKRSRIGAGIAAGNGYFFSIPTAKAASLPTGVLFGGVLACPPVDLAVKQKLATPFSVTPIIAQGVFRPGRTLLTMAPPSSSTKAG